VSDRAKFEVVDVTRDLAEQDDDGSYDLVMAFEMIHDLARPVQALTTMHRLGKPDAVHLVMDEKVAESFEAPTDNPVERLMYAASVLHCLPVGRTETPSAGQIQRPTDPKVRSLFGQEPVGVSLPDVLGGGVPGVPLGRVHRSVSVIGQVSAGGWPNSWKATSAPGVHHDGRAAVHQHGGAESFDNLGLRRADRGVGSGWYATPPSPCFTTPTTRPRGP
jgi:hypothetical protein